MAEFIMQKDKPDLRRDLTNIINRHSRENGSNTPDFILAEYLLGCLDAFDRATLARESWYSLDKTEVISG
jgi:hypothetical protein